MLKVAIVGNIASGKTTVERIIAGKGFKVYDSDKIAHELLAGSDAVKHMFAEDDILTNGEIDRKKLGNIVFNDPKKLKLLELILHPQIVTELLKIFQRENGIVFVSVPQLFEAKMETLFDKKIFVTAKKETRLERLISRNGLTREYAQKRINAQIPDEDKIPLCDYIIDNNSTMESLHNQTELVISSIRSTFS